MAKFSVISREEAQRLVTASGRLAETEYREYVRSLNMNTAGRIELSEGEHPISIRARLKAAARAEGRTLVIQRQGKALVFWLDEASA